MEVYMWLKAILFALGLFSFIGLLTYVIVNIGQNNKKVSEDDLIKGFLVLEYFEHKNKINKKE
jgi:hypothetical protein